MDAHELQLWSVCRDLGADPGAREDARQAILERHLALVRYTVDRLAISFPSSHIENGDMYQAGVLGLMDAFERFDPGLGNDFSTFATRRIRGSVLDELRALDWIPRSVRKRAQDVAHTAAKLALELLRPPDDEEMARAMGLPLEEYAQMLSKTQVPPVHSLDDLMDADRGAVAALPKAADDLEAQASLREQVEILARGIEGLSERERLVLTLYYYEELTLKEIARVLDLTESRICQIHSGAILKLRGHQLCAAGSAAASAKPAKPAKPGPGRNAQDALPDARAMAVADRPGPP